MKIKGAPKKPLTKQQKSTKPDLSYWEYVDALHSVQNSNSSVKRSASSSEDPIQRQNILMLNQFHPCIQDSIENIIECAKRDFKITYFSLFFIIIIIF